jgi:predicted Rossmann-fold nucleotide-binding protein
VIVLYGAEFWRKVINFDALVATGMISPQDLGLFKICATVDEAYGYVTKQLTSNSRSPRAKKKAAGKV